MALGLNAVKILVVENFVPFREIIRVLLQSRAEFQLVGEAADGLEAVQKAKDLQPDIILLDLGLPSLNGMEVAKRIPEVVPNAKVLFVSQESSTDVVEKAFRVGARGYILKSRVLADLLPAIAAVLGGRHFVGGGIESNESTLGLPE